MRARSLQHAWAVKPEIIDNWHGIPVFGRSYWLLINVFRGKSSVAQHGNDDLVYYKFISEPNARSLTNEGLQFFKRTINAPIEELCFDEVTFQTVEILLAAVSGSINNKPDELLSYFYAQLLCWEDFRLKMTDRGRALIRTVLKHDLMRFLNNQSEDLYQWLIVSLVDKEDWTGALTQLEKESSVGDFYRKRYEMWLRILKMHYKKI